MTTSKISTDVTTNIKESKFLLKKDNLIHNINLYHKCLPDNYKYLIACIKANGYGHGLIQMAQMLEDKAEFLAVASMEEAIELSQNNITTPILILYNYTKEDLINCPNWQNIRLSPSNISSLQSLIKFIQNCKQDQKEYLAESKIKIHLHFDTGMSWGGFSLSDITLIKGLIEKYSDDLDIEGVWTHLATSDELDNNYCNLQTQKFIDIIEELKQYQINPKYIHCYNTGGILRSGFNYNKSQNNIDKYCNTVRSGIGLYGYYPNIQDKERLTEIIQDSLKPILEWRCNEYKLLYLPESTLLGYGSTFQAKRDTIIALLPIGYSNGLPRNLGGGTGSVILKNKKYPIVGRICMNACFIDITDYILEHLPDCDKADLSQAQYLNKSDLNELNDFEFIFIGGESHCELTFDYWAYINSTISYEQMVRLNNKHKRIIT
jgi:alanine racemase